MIKESDGYLPLGQLLIERGLATETDVELALAEQQREGGYLGRHLLLAGVVQRRDMYQALAEQWGTALVDLVASPPQTDLVANLDHEWALSSQWLPYRQNGDVTVIVTSASPTEELLSEATTS